MKKFFIIGLVALAILLQYQLWFSQGGLMNVIHLKKNIHQQEKRNQGLDQQNQQLVAQIKDLKSGKAAIEEHARHDLGMVKKGEVFYRVVQDDKKTKK